MAFLRWGAASLVATVLVLCGNAAQAGVLDDCLNEVRQPGGISAAKANVGPLGALEASPSVRDAVPLADLRPIEDFHPETDRWTDHHNRIKLTGWVGSWMPSGELDIQATYVLGLRLSWEVPGFIAIRWDSGFAPSAELEVRRPAVGGHTDIHGLVHSHTLSIGIFNPELSVSGLAFWAGFGVGAWVYDFDDTRSGIRYTFNEIDGLTGDEDALNLAGNVFIELDYEVMDTFHIGLGLRQHFLLADHTNLSNFVGYNGAPAAGPDGRNDGPMDDLAGVTEITLNLSVLF